MREDDALFLRYVAGIEKRKRVPGEDLTSFKQPPELEKLKLNAASVIASIQASTADYAVTSYTPGLLTTTEETAAVSGRFEPSDLIRVLQVQDTDRVAILRNLAPLCSVESNGSDTLWLLRHDRREAALRRLVGEKRLNVALARALPATDNAGEMLRNILRGNFPVTDKLDRQGLLALSWALEALATVELPKPDISQVQQILARTQFLAEYEVLLEKGFFGRESELSELSAFLEAGGTNQQLLLLTGLGGAGKSTLLAKFARDTVASRTATVVILDFDRPGIDGSDTLWLEMEMARQVGAQITWADSKLRQSREEVRGSFTEQLHGNLPSSASSLEGLRGVRVGVLYPIAEVLKSSNGNRPLLLIFDTFEEVAQRNVTGRILEWLREVQSALWGTPLRVVISGRLFEHVQGFLKSYVNRTLDLGELAPATAEQLLLRLRVSEPVAHRLAYSNVLPRRPLELQLLAKLVTDSNSADIDELERELREGGKAARELFAGLVYRRVLLRVSVPDEYKEGASEITDEVLRELAYPGLVLRYVTAELIQSVLVPALNLPQLDTQQAKLALNLLARHEWLAFRQGDEVWHRRDLRRSILKPMIAENPDRALSIHRAAIAFFERELNERYRAEAVYHDLMLRTSGDDDTAYDLEALRKFVSYFEADRIDLPAAGAALLSFALSGEVEVEKIRLLPKQLRETAYQAKGRSLVDSREFATGLRLYNRGITQLTDWERTLLYCTAQWDELRSRLQAPASIQNDRELGEYVLPAAVTGTITLDELASQIEKVGANDSTNTFGVSTAIQGLTVGIGLIAKGTLLPEDARQTLRRVLPTFDKRSRTDPILAKTLIYLKTFLGVNFDRLPLAPSTIRLDPKWLTDAPVFLGACGTVPPPALALLSEAIKVLNDGVGGQRSVRVALSYIQSLGASVDIIVDWPKAEADSLWRFLEAANPEFRDPARFALLDAFGDPASYPSLANLFGSGIPIRFDDLEPQTFTQSISPDPEHGLEPYVEMADRSGSLQRVLEQALVLRPQSRTLNTVLEAIKNWQEAARSSVFASVRSARTDMPLSNDRSAVPRIQSAGKAREAAVAGGVKQIRKRKAMLNTVHQSYIEKLPIGPIPERLEGVDVRAVDIDKLPDALVTGSNLIQFPATATPELKSSVALSLLAAQRVATNDAVVRSPDQWLQRHNTVLQNLNWLNETTGFVNSQFRSINVAVHQAIIPFLAAAFGPAVAAGALILTALKQLQEMDKSSPWITLFDQQSQRFNITEYQFSVVQVVNNTVQVRLAAARFDASYGQTQVLFFKIKQEHAAFQSASGTYSTQADLLTEMNAALKTKLEDHTAAFIRSLPNNLLK